jgi:hypothetical protein
MMEFCVLLGVGRGGKDSLQSSLEAVGEFDLGSYRFNTIPSVLEAAEVQN